MFLSDGRRFSHSGSWTGAGQGSDGWYRGDFDGDGKDDIFRYRPGYSGAEVFLAYCAATPTSSILLDWAVLAIDEDMMLEISGLRQREMSYQEEVEFLTPFLERVMMGEAASVFKIRKAYEETVGHVVRMVKIRQLLHRHGYWGILEKSGCIIKERINRK